MPFVFYGFQHLDYVVLAVDVESLFLLGFCCALPFYLVVPDVVPDPVID